MSFSPLVLLGNPQKDVAFFLTIFFSGGKIQKKIAHSGL